MKQKRAFDFANKDYGEPLRIPEGLSNYSERAYAFAIGSLESKHCRKLKEALRNCHDRIVISELKQQLKEDCGIEL